MRWSERQTRMLAEMGIRLPPQRAAAEGDTVLAESDAPVARSNPAPSVPVAPAEVREPAADAAVMSQLVREIVQRVYHGRGHRPAKVMLVQPSTIPKTSSGKIQRSRLRQMIAGNELADRILYPSGAHRD